MNETTNSAEQKVSAYIHIPFCEHICYYCDLNDSVAKKLLHSFFYKI
ncbi:hypothetical protein SE1_00575 [Enterococcus hirae EnGen0127]|nr:hypothetical protein [Enterococcus hirae]EOF60606.1 hypothetical protein SE1_00575 [Enterococcus hirae EnGen0127]